MKSMAELCVIQIPRLQLVKQSLTAVDGCRSNSVSVASSGKGSITSSATGVRYTHKYTHTVNVCCCIAAGQLYNTHTQQKPMHLALEISMISVNIDKITTKTSLMHFISKHEIKCRKYKTLSNAKIR